MWSIRQHSKGKQINGSIFKWKHVFIYQRLHLSDKHKLLSCKWKFQVLLVLPLFSLKQIILYSLILPLPDLEQGLAATKEATADIMQLSLELPVGSSQNSFSFMPESQIQIYPNWN